MNERSITPLGESPSDLILVDTEAVQRDLYGLSTLEVGAYLRVLMYAVQFGRAYERHFPVVSGLSKKQWADLGPRLLSILKDSGWGINHASAVTEVSHPL